MKIIFDDEQEKDKFVRRLCPLDVLEEAKEECRCYEDSPHKCEQCWERNVEMGVRENVED